MNKIEIISASAGSGKTYKLTELLEDGVKSGKVRPYAVLATTFTNKSAAELQERVRVRLLAAGRTTDAQQLTAARIGTVNSVCGRLVGDFAFELGLSPELSVLDEDQAESALHRSLADVLTAAEEEELAGLSERMEEFNWQQSVGQVVALARSNGIPAAQLADCNHRSAREFVKLLGKPAANGAALDQALLTAMENFVKGVDKLGELTSGTKKAVDRVQRHLQQMRQGISLAWKDWVALSKLSGTAQSNPLLKPVNEAAAAHDRHPRLHHDVTRAIELVFDLATRAMESYQQRKRELGAIDFVDQESYALDLLGRPHVREYLASTLDLVLVDEFQDTSPIQLAIFLRLAEAAPRCVWVGDQKQAIYGFRGADPSLMDAVIDQILQGKEPETLPKSYRSRPGLVDFTSALFSQAFPAQGIPAVRVKLKANLKKEDEPANLGPFIECWQLKAKNKSQDAAALAAAIQTLLEDTSVRVRDRKDGQARSVVPGDVAILCRTNIECLNVAGELACLGIHAALPRNGLMATLEALALLAGLRVWVDGRDTLAAAELARLIDFAGNDDQWFKTILDKPGAAALEGLPVLAKLKQERERQSSLGVGDIFDSVVQYLGLPDLCRRWGDAETRLANVEALRGHVVNYVASCATLGTGCTSAGLVAHLAGLAVDENDSQGVSEDQNSVVVSTWHAAKGLEWPIVVLFPLSRYGSDTLALGVQIQSDQKQMTLADPLADRWIRYWPNPYVSANNNTPFHGRLADHPATEIAQARAAREDLRRLYVGWTRARDRVVLADRKGSLTSDLLQLLNDDKESLVSEPTEPKLKWAGQSVEAVIREVEPMESKPAKPMPGVSYVARGERPFPDAFVQPSGLGGDDLQLTQCTTIGERIAISGNCEWSALGLAIHGFLCADRPGLAAAVRGKLLEDLLQRWGVQSVVNPGGIIAASDSLRTWIAGQWPEAVWQREWPALHRRNDGSVIRGSCDLVLAVKQGLVLLDHKSFPGTVPQALNRAAEYAGQVHSYAAAIEAATGKKVLSQWIHLPVSGIVVPLPRISPRPQRG